MRTRTITAFLGVTLASVPVPLPVAAQAQTTGPQATQAKATQAKATEAQATRPTGLDQWPDAARDLYYTQDQGSRLIPLAWLKALEQPDGQPFLTGSLVRYGYIPGSPPNGLPIGFVTATDPTGETVGLTCAACHTRQIVVADRTYRIDGGPAFADFAAFVGDLDRAVLAVLADSGRFKTFSDAVIGANASDSAQAILKADVTVWSARFHALMSVALPTRSPWGPGRIDAISMIFDRIAGLDLGSAPTYLIPANIAPAGAPVRNPFLWNSWRQDFTQWTGFAANGNEVLALSRNLGQVYGVFGVFHPRSTAGSTAIFDRNYLVDNSANFRGLGALETAVTTLKPPRWSWPVDQALADKGKLVFERPDEGGGKACADCHGIHPGQPRPPTMTTWSTPLVNAGTDRSAWLVLTQKATTGALAGASITGVVSRLGPEALRIDLVKIAVTGAIGEFKATMAQVPPPPAPAHAPPPKQAMAPMPAMPMAQMDAAFHVRGMAVQGMAVQGMAVQGMAVQAPSAGAAGPVPFSYEARVLQGVWAAAPYLHNGSVPTLADLLKPVDQRPQAFKVGSAYDIEAVGLAIDQPGSNFTLHTTGCDELASGDSRCGHEYGTRLPNADKAALLEYLKTL